MADFDRKENTNDKGILLRTALRSLQQGIWTSLPGFITKYNAAEMTCEVQTTIKALARSAISMAIQIAPLPR